MKLSTHGADFLAAHEGLRLVPYNDPVGFATVGVGHLLHRSAVTQADLQKYKGFTRAQALALLQRDAAVAVNAVNRLVHVPLTQHQFDALVSFTFNVGTGALEHSTLLHELNLRHYSKAADALLAWDMAGGHHLAGLKTRRVAERKLFLSKDAHQVAKPARKVLPLVAGGWRAYVYGDTDCRKSLLVKLAKLAKARHTRIFVRSGKRTYQEQVVLYNHYRKYGYPLAARPGTSNHEVRPPDHEGHAADCGIEPDNRNIGDVVPRSVLRAHGLVLPVKGESWHVEEA